MAFNQVTAASLTPSRPAPSAPVSRDIQNVLASSGYASSFSVGTPSPSSSSYTYSGIGGSPNRTSDSGMSANVIRAGPVQIKDDGIVSWLWRPRWLVLKDQTLSIHKNEVRIFPPLVCNLILAVFYPRYEATRSGSCRPRHVYRTAFFPVLITLGSWHHTHQLCQ